MKTFVERYSSGKSVLVVLTFAMVIYAVMMFVTLPTLSHEMDGLFVFDMRPMGYSVEEGYEILENISDFGVSYYRGVQLPLDFVYPALLALFGVLAFAYFGKRIRIPSLIYMLPLIAGIFDYLENIGIYIMLSDLNSPSVVKMSSVFSIIKSMSTTIFITILLVVSVYVASKTVYEKMRS